MPALPCCLCYSVLPVPCETGAGAAAVLDHLCAAHCCRLGPTLLSRVGRGALVALPAVGALFVAHLARQDWKRMVEESKAGAQAARYSFAVACLFDAMDVVSHGVGGWPAVCDV